MRIQWLSGREITALYAWMRGVTLIIEQKYRNDFRGNIFFIIMEYFSFLFKGKIVKLF
ncbi:hypothetical protein SACS_0922 [Parasaccharibacter apium]|uniref:Uncharacterized protein n=1 Tax=Parasaccharibacter apium TaxID=1510841 RepID=A0A7U7G5Y6_9PROT|nr:hypothetical protein SACS_0922 [Parasaccharibacter apium]